MKIQENVNLKPFNTFGVSAKSRYLIEIETPNDLYEAQSVDFYSKSSKMVLGGGSNVLFTKDFDGCLLKNNIKGIELVKAEADWVQLKVGAGEGWHNFVMHCIAKGYAGVENLSLIPGNVGASPMQNIGAYGVEVKDLVVQVDCLDLKDGSFASFNNQECQFAYRSSIFKTHLKNQKLITHVHYRLNTKPVFNTTYGAIEQELEKMKVSEWSIQSIGQAVINIRQSKLPDPAKLGNAGSFFKNPVVEDQVAEALKKSHPTIPAYPAGQGFQKLAAGWLIEQTGWKGKRIGNCGVHVNQALVLVNYGGANGMEINGLADQIQESVKREFGIMLEKEVNIVGI